MESSMEVREQGWRDSLDVELYVGDEIRVYIDGTTVGERIWEREEELDSRTDAIQAFAVHARDRCHHASNKGSNEEQAELLRVARIMGRLERHPTEGELRESAHRVNEEV